MNYLDEHLRRSARFTAMSQAQKVEAVSRFSQFFSDFSPESVGARVDATYADDVWFNDTLKTVRGRSALRSYLLHSAQAVQSCRVQILDSWFNERDDCFVRWVMTIRFKRFRRGVDTRTVGISHLRFDSQGLVQFHQDFWDSSSGLFEHVPVLGTAIRWIKSRL
jgi:SnoaL-like domain